MEPGEDDWTLILSTDGYKTMNNNQDAGLSHW